MPGVNRLEHLVAIFAIGLAELDPFLAVQCVAEPAVPEGNVRQDADGQHFAAVGCKQPLIIAVAILDGPIPVLVVRVLPAGNQRLLAVASIGDGDRVVLHEVDPVPGDHILFLQGGHQTAQGGQILIEVVADALQLIDPFLQLVELLVVLVDAACRQERSCQKHRADESFHIVCLFIRLEQIARIDV